ncbi:hypothetical protein KEM55_003089 [Ascosphaera atra]|nr:hypothetical protein KEM55_003089 [Ascosphaera atra]
MWQLTARLRPSLAQSRAFRPLIPYKSQQQTTPDPKRNAQQPGQQPQDQNQQDQLKQQQNQQGQQNEANKDGKPALSQENADNTSSILHDTDPATNTLLAPVYIPEDPHTVLKETHPATSILANSGLVVQRQMEMMNVLVGFEQANKYVILDAHGNHVGYMAEQDDGIGKTMMRQIAGTHRSVVTWVFDRSGKEVLRVSILCCWSSFTLSMHGVLIIWHSSIAHSHSSTPASGSTTP